MKKNKSARLPVKLAVTAAVVLFVLAGITAYSLKRLYASDYFKVKNVTVRGGSAQEFSYLTGRNIFSIDLEYEAARMLELCPGCTRIDMVRLLPDRIFVDFIKRKAVALVRLYRYFASDEGGTLFYETAPPEESSLPVIHGLERKIFGPKPGKRYNVRELSLALNIIKEANKNAALKNYKIGKIDVANINNTTIFISFPANPKTLIVPESLEVKFGGDNVKDKISILARLIIAGRDDIANVKYIDLRFKEPVIKLKDAK